MTFNEYKKLTLEAREAMMAGVRAKEFQEQKNLSDKDFVKLQILVRNLELIEALLLSSGYSFDKEINFRTLPTVLY